MYCGMLLSKNGNEITSNRTYLKLSQIGPLCEIL